MRHRPDRTVSYADGLLPWFGVLAGLTIAAHLYALETVGLPRVPMLFGGAFLGLLAVRLHHHRFRSLGFVPLGSGLAALVAAVATLFDFWGPFTLGLFAFFLGLALGGLLRYRDRTRVRMGFFTAFALLGCICAVVIVQWFGRAYQLNPGVRATFIWIHLVVACLLPLVSALMFAQAFVELLVEPFFRKMYKVQLVGPGLAKIPTSGPVLVIANHAAWFDPLFVAEAMPRATTQMMTASFYDVRGILFLMKHVFKTIRVAEANIRRDAPELKQAVNALHAGRCVVIFPEGYLRRREDQPLRRFGRGVWQILSERPNTPVLPLWIEGSWGSYFSHANGPPTKNKPKDQRLKVVVSVGEPVVVPAEILADHWQTRLFLMKQINHARTHQGLPELTLDELTYTAQPGESGETENLTGSNRSSEVAAPGT